MIAPAGAEVESPRPIMTTDNTTSQATALPRTTPPFHAEHVGSLLLPAERDKPRVNAP